MNKLGETGVILAPWSLEIVDLHVNYLKQKSEIFTVWRKTFNQSYLILKRVKKKIKKVTFLLN